LLLFGALAFALLILSGYYPPEVRAVNLDTDWFYRKGVTFVLAVATGTIGTIARGLDAVFVQQVPARLAFFCGNPLDSFARFSATLSGTRPRSRKSTAVSPVPIGIPVVLALALLALLSFVFMRFFG
jgi:multicomponent Na+:H+ antiporter subunit D